MTFGNRLAQLRVERGFHTRKSFAEKIGIPETTLRNYETDAREPGHTFLKQMSDFFKVSTDYLLGITEEKERRSTHQLKASEFEHIEKYRSLDDPGRTHVDTVLDWEAERSGQLRQSQSENESLKLQLSQGQFLNRLLSYYGRIAAAGKSYGFEDMICGTIQVPLTDENRNADYAIGVSGNSMEPDFTGDDIVYVQKASHLGKGEIGIFQKDNCIYIKKVGDGELLSINPDYGPIPGKDVKVLGRVLGKIDGDYRIIK